MPGSIRPIQVVGIAGSLRAQSYNRALLRAAQEVAPADINLTIQDLAAIPLYNADVEAQGDPQPVVRLKSVVLQADALLLAVPEYNYGVSGVLKNTIDWLSRPPQHSALQGKPAALMGASPGMTGTARAQLQLRQAFVFTQTYALLRPEVLVARADEKFDAQGRLTDEATRTRLRELLEALVIWTRRFAASPGTVLVGSR
jgi:chromate reductase